MKNRILTFIIGLLVGAIITTIGFCVYTKSIRGDREMMPPMMGMNEGGVPPERPNGGRGEMRGMNSPQDNNISTENNSKGE